MNTSFLQLNKVQKTAHFGFWEFDIKNQSLSWSDEIYRIFELDKNVFKPSYKKFLEIIHPDDRDMVSKAYEDSLISKKPYEVTHRILMEDGRVKYLFEQCDTKYDPDGQALVSFGSVLDITTLKEYEDNLKEKNQEIVKLNKELTLYKHIVENVDVGISVANTNQNKNSIIYVNPAFEKITGYTSEDIINTNCNILQGKDRNQKAAKVIKKSIMKQQPCEVEIKNYKKDGTLFWNLLSLTPFFDKSNQLEYYIGVQHDITKQKLLYDQLKNLIDLQDNIIILTNSKEMTFANKKFFDFTHYESLVKFKQSHPCICELFIENDKFFHLGKIKDEQNWIEEIQKLPENERMVGILSKTLEINAFMLHINKFDEYLQVVSLTDISKTVLKQIMLEEKTILDKLTGAFNREYFDLYYSTFGRFSSKKVGI
ncbi:MAG: PAS domain S-box protein [Campylobacterota bacterium]|nr:PAS domain S-box protein [Campylobacterota bacterium]